MEKKDGEIRLRAENVPPAFQSISVDIDSGGASLTAPFPQTSQNYNEMAKRRVWRTVDMGLGLALPFLSSTWYEKLPRPAPFSSALRIPRE